MSSVPIDFLRPPRAPRVGWMLLVIGLVAIAAAVWLDQRWAAERAAAELADEEARAADRAMRAPPAPVEPSLDERRWQQAQLELRRPWLPTLRAIEAATANPVFLLAMSIDPSKGLVRLDAEAPSFDHALAYVQVLEEAGVLHPAALISHEQVGPAPNAPGAVRFTTATHWVMPR